MQLKFIDDSSKMASINLKRSLASDPETRPRPLNFHERHQAVLLREDTILQDELDRFHSWTQENKLTVNSAKCFTMMFSQYKK